MAVEPFGSEVIVDGKAGRPSIKIRTAPASGPHGEHRPLRADPAALRLFDRATGAALS